MHVKSKTQKLIEFCSQDTLGTTDMHYRLPPEILLYISDILGDMGELRTMVNLHKALKWRNMNTSKYFIKVLIVSRKSCNIKKYDEKMIELWERTGIDDGVPIQYLKQHLTKHTQMYRTIWSYDRCGNNFWNIVDMRQMHNKYVSYTYRIFLDKRSNSTYRKGCKNTGQYLCEYCAEYYDKQTILRNKYLKFNDTDPKLDWIFNWPINIQWLYGYLKLPK